MTWAELHGVLRGKGLIRADDAMRAEAAVGVVRSIAYDSRKVERGDVFVALKGLHADGTLFAEQAIALGAVAIVSEQPAPPDTSVAWAIVGILVGRLPGPPLPGGRVHRQGRLRPGPQGGPAGRRSGTTSTRTTRQTGRPRRTSSAPSSR